MTNTYLATQTNKHGWCVAIKTKPRGRKESNDVEEDVLYQEGSPSHTNEVIEVEGIFGLQDVEGGPEEVDEPEEPKQHVQVQEEKEEVLAEDNQEMELEDDFDVSSSKED